MEEDGQPEAAAQTPQQPQQQAAPQAPIQQPQQQVTSQGPTQQPVKEGWLDQLTGAAVATAVDLIDNTLQGDQKTFDQIRGGMRNARQEIVAKGQQNKSVGAEIYRGLTGADENLGNKVMGAAEFAGDVFGGLADAVGIVDRADEDIPWNENYQYAQYDLGLSETNTWYGGLVQEALSFALGGGAIGSGAKALGAGQTLQGVSAVGGDFILDYFSNAEDGNLSNMVMDNMVTGTALANPLSAALAHSEEDNPHWRRLKNAIEGAFPSIALTAVSRLYKGVRRGNEIIAAGGSAEEATAAARAVAQAEPDEAFAAAAKAENQTASGRPGIYHGTYGGDSIRETGFRPSTGETDTLGRGVYFTDNPELAQSYGSEVLRGDASNLNIKEISYEEAQEVFAKYGGMNQYGGPVDVDALAKELGGEYDGVRVSGLYDDDPAVTEVLLFDSAKADAILEKVEGKPPTVDPQDRVVQIDKAPDVNTSAASFWEDAQPGGGASLIDEIDAQQITTIDGLREFVRGKIPGVDVDEISRRLSRQPDEHIYDTFLSLSDFADTGNIEVLEPLRFKNTFDIKGVDAGGAVVLDTLVKSVGERIAVLSEEMARLTEVDAPFKTQARQILNRAEALVTIKKEATQFSSKGLENWKSVPPALKRAVLKDRQQISEIFGQIREGIESTDPQVVMKTKKQLAKLAVGLSGTKGDPKLQMQMLEGLARVSMKRINSVFINSILSGPLTHARNIAGNLTSIGERSVSRALGGGGFRATASFNGIFESFGDALAVARESFNSPYSITTASSKVVDYAARDRKVIENLSKVASTRGEKFAVGVVETTYDLTNNPWFNWPGKALQAGDDFTKTLLARMEMRYEAALEADEMVKGIGPQVRPDQYSSLRNAAYDKISKKKIAPNGNILDHDLIEITEAAAFQRPLEGWVMSFGKSIQNAPGGRIIMPFFKTGHNITRYGVQASPLAPLSSEWRQVMRSGTADQKAIMRGRMALGSITASGAAVLANADLLTGYGPPPGPERDLWLKNHEPNSIRIGDKWVSYQAIPGMSLVWSTVADITNMVSELSDGNADYVLGASTFFVANAITSQPMFQGVLNLSEILDFRRLTPDRFNEAAGNFANTLVGGASARRSLENALAQNMHEYRNWSEAVISKLTGGLSNLEGITNPVPRIDILTGKPMQGKYGNKLNLLNPFTVVGHDVHPIVEVVSRLDYPLKFALPSKVSGVNLEPAEQSFIAEQIYDGGNFPKSLKAVLESDKFWGLYDRWNADMAQGRAVPKEESEWWAMLDRTVGSFVSRARLQLKGGTSDISQRFRQTFPERSARAGSGSAGNLTQADQGALRDIIRYAKFD